MPNRYLVGLNKAIWETELISPRCMLVIAELSWATMLFFPGDTFQRKAYSVLNMLATEEIWGLVFFLCACVQSFIIFKQQYNTNWSRLYSGFNALLWTYVVVGMIYSVKPPPAAMAGNIALAIGAVWIFARPYILAGKLLCHTSKICNK